MTFARKIERHEQNAVLLHLRFGIGGLDRILSLHLEDSALLELVALDHTAREADQRQDVLRFRLFERADRIRRTAGFVAVLGAGKGMLHRHSADPAGHHRSGSGVASLAAATTCATAAPHAATAATTTTSASTAATATTSAAANAAVRILVGVVG